MNYLNNFALKMKTCFAFSLRRIFSGIFTAAAVFALPAFADELAPLHSNHNLLNDGDFSAVFEPHKTGNFSQSNQNFPPDSPPPAAHSSPLTFVGGVSIPPQFTAAQTYTAHEYLVRSKLRRNQTPPTNVRGEVSFSQHAAKSAFLYSDYLRADAPFLPILSAPNNAAAFSRDVQYAAEGRFLNSPAMGFFVVAAVGFIGSSLKSDDSPAPQNTGGGGGGSGGGGGGGGECTPTATQVKVGDVCRLPENTAECAGLVAGEVYDVGEADNCRAITMGDCPANMPILDGAACRLPENNAECAGLVAGEIYDVGEADNCRAITMGDCPANMPILDGADCRLPENTAECASLVAGEIYDVSEADNCRAPTVAEACEADPNHANRRRVFSAPAEVVINPGVLVNVVTDGNFLARGITLTSNAVAEFSGIIFQIGAGATGASGGGFRMALIREATNVTSQLSLPNVFDSNPQAGDIIVISYVGRINTGTRIVPGDGGAEVTMHNPATPANMRGAQLFRIYEDAAGTLRVTPGNTGNARDITRTALAVDSQTACSDITAANQFFLDDNWMTTQTYTTALRTEFPLRGILGGLLNENNAVKAGNFFFSAGQELKNFHMEYKSEKEIGGANLRAFSGVIKTDGGKTEIAYYKTSAHYAVSSGAEIFAAGAFGQIRSARYADSSRLRGFSIGAFFRGRRTGDWLQTKIESPLGDNLRHRTRFSATANIGGKKSQIRIGAERNIEDKTTAAKILYRRNF